MLAIASISLSSCKIKELQARQKQLTDENTALKAKNEDLNVKNTECNSSLDDCNKKNKQMEGDTAALGNENRYLKRSGF